MKDELKKIKSNDCNYIINLESSNDGNGTHWLSLKIENRDCVYFDSYGMLPPEEIISFCKRIQKISSVVQHKRNSRFVCSDVWIFRDGLSDFSK